MKTKLNLCLTALLFLFTFYGSIQQALATHGSGAEISYKCTSTPGVMEVTLVVYRRCDGGTVAFCPSPCGSACSQTMNIMGVDGSYSGSSFGSFPLTLVSVRDVGIQKQCPSAKNTCNNTGCVTPGTYAPAIERYEFKGLVNIGSTSGIPANCCNVRFIWEFCCRNSNIQTGSSDLNMYVDATVNRCLAMSPCNSSPVFTTDPVVLVNGNENSIQSYAAFDIDDDSLSFSFAPALQAFNTPVFYNGPFNFDRPMPWTGSATGQFPTGIHCNSQTGEVAFTPPNTGSLFTGVIAVEVKQWKKINGVPTVIGKTRRDMLSIVTPNLPNNTPQLQTVPFDSMYHTPKTALQVCAGSQLCFTVTAKDTDFLSDTTYLSWDSVLAPYGATFLPTYNPANRLTTGPREDNYQFCWTPSDSLIRDNPYLFSISAADNKCPSPGRVGRVFSIKVIGQPNISITKTNKACGKWQVGYTNNKPGQLITASTIRVAKEPSDSLFTGGSIVATNTAAAPVIQFTKGGTYYIKLEITQGNCLTTFYDSLIVNNPFGVNTTDTLVCPATATTLTAAAYNGSPAYTYRWFNTISDTFTAPLNSNVALPTFTITPQVTRWYVVQARDMNGCRAYDSAYVQTKNNIKQVTVTSPKCNGSNTGSILVNDSVTASFYQYKLNNGAFSAVKLFDSLVAGNYTITVKDTENCSISTQVIITQPQKVEMTVSKQNISCSNRADGKITVTPVKGKSPFTYSVSGSAFTPSNIFANLTAGNYLVSIKDSMGCFDTGSVTITAPPAISAGTVSGPSTSLVNTTDTFSITQQPGLNILWVAEKGIIVGGQTAATMYVRWDSVGAGIVGVAVYKDSTCGDTASMNVNIGSVGLNELANHWGLRVYPNPANHHLNIQLQQLPESTTIQLYDVQGRLVIQQELKLTQQLNIESLTPGMYMLKIGAWSGQVVKE